MNARTWAIVAILAASLGTAAGFGIGRLSAPGSPPVVDTARSARLDVTLECQTSWTCNVTLLLDGATKWTIPIGCEEGPCAVPNIPTFHNWTGASSCQAFPVEARSAISYAATVLLCDEGRTSVRLQAAGVPPDRTALLNVTIVCETASDCDVTLFIDGIQKWTLVVLCTSPPCVRADVATSVSWTGLVCKAVVVEARSEISDTETGALCDGQAAAVILLARGPASRVIGVSLSRSADGTNWTVVLTTVPPGLSTSDASLAIFDAGGATALLAEPFSSLSYTQDGAVFVGDGDALVEVAERLLISASRYPLGYRIEIRDSLGLLFTGTLQ